MASSSPTVSGPEGPARARVPMLRWAGIAYGLLAAAAIAWNGWAHRPWLYLDPAAAAAGIDWGATSRSGSRVRWG